MPRTRWRWDQGRLSYLRFETLRRLSPFLLMLEGEPTRGPDALAPLREMSGLPFPPSRYTVWRNFGRVFKLTGLAVNPENRLLCTDLCRQIDPERDEAWSADEYLAFLIPRISFPSPAFQGYSLAPTVFPFCAVLKLLMARLLAGGPSALSLTEVFTLLIGNRLSGGEPLDHFIGLTATGDGPEDEAEERQVRELLIFLSQLSCLRWSDGQFLFLDIEVEDTETIRWLGSVSDPIWRTRQRDANMELLGLMAVEDAGVPLVTPPTPSSPEDEAFVDGRKIRRNHLRIERNPRLREALLASLGTRPECDTCRLFTPDRYPWARTLLEAHHLLPLGSGLRAEQEGTRVNDLRALCPNCHRATHQFYAVWLGEHDLSDFESLNQVLAVYEEARSRFQA